MRFSSRRIQTFKIREEALSNSKDWLEGTEQGSQGDKDAGESVAGRGGKQERGGGRSIA